MYFAPNTTAGFLDAITTAVHDAEREPSVISISWGEAEKALAAAGAAGLSTRRSRRPPHSASRSAARLATTARTTKWATAVRTSTSRRRARGCLPAAAPRLESTDTQITSEVVWHEPAGDATGGGVSEFFAPPPYQQGAEVPPSANPEHKVGRGVPDVAGDADPGTGYKVRVDGRDMVVGGTSAVAPLYAGLIALMNQQVGSPVGFLNPTAVFRAASREAFRDIVSGDNGDYQAGPGWDACTGPGQPATATRS